MLLGFMGVVVIWAILLTWKWPFTMGEISKVLQNDSHRIVKIGSLHMGLLTPGYVAENLTFYKNPKTGGDAFTIRRMSVVADWTDLLLMRKRIRQAVISGLRMRIVADPPGVQYEKPQSRQTFSGIGELIFEDAVFAFASSEQEAEPLTITLASASIERISASNSSPFRTTLSINEPRANIHSEGQLGPWNWSDPGKTPLSGSFVVDHGDLSSLGGVAGTFTGNGKFRGPLQQVTSTGYLDAPQFQVPDHSHTAQLSTKFHVTVNGLNGDTTLDHVESQLRNTLIETDGKIKAANDRPGKTASLRFSVEHGRVEDFLYLFSETERPSMVGALTLKANIDLPPGPPGFLEKVKIDGDFDIAEGRFGSGQTQKEVNHLSKSAEGMTKKEENQSPTTVLSELKGHVVAQKGKAVIANAAWTAPDASASLGGTYNLLDTTFDIHGLLRTTGKLSDTSSGLKALFLKAATPFWKKNKVTVLPFTITGKARQPIFALSMKKRSS